MKKITALSLICALLLSLTGCSTIDDIMKRFSPTPSAEELLNNVPIMDEDAYNRFQFKMDIVAYSKDQDGKSFTMTGHLETYKDVSHMYGLEVDFSPSGYHAEPETWADMGNDERYTDMGSGFYIDSIANPKVIYDLADVINTRDKGLLVSETDTAYTLSWEFVHDNNYLFDAIITHFTDDLELEGGGRITAVLDKETLQFEYFTVIVSASNEERAGAIIDMAFEWEEINKDSPMGIPVEVSASAYEAATGIVTDGGYDKDINPIAEAFAKSYGGIAEISSYEGGTTLFWTKEEDEDVLSATVVCIKTDNAHTLYEENCEFLTALCGEPFERMEGGAYYYDASTAQLTLVMEDIGWYTEFIITGKPGTSQGALRKPLITYKSKLEATKGGS